MAQQVISVNLGLALPGDDSHNSPWGPGDLLLAQALQTLDARLGTLEEKTTVTGIVSNLGVVTLEKTSAGAFTLPAPLQGAPGAGGYDGQILNIACITAFAHTVTTPANKLNGSKQTITFTAAAGNSVQLLARGGVWYVIGGIGFTLS